MRYTLYVIAFGVAALLLILSIPTMDEYMEQLDRNWYINWYNRPTINTGTLAPVIDTVEIKSGSSITNSGAINNSGSELINTGSVNSSLNGYLPYQNDQLQAALEAGKQIALFFHADRCPSCNALDQDIIANGGKTAENQVVFKADYDTENDLKKQYNITSQHTIVYLDSKGDVVKTDKTSLTLEDLVSLF